MTTSSRLGIEGAVPDFPAVWLRDNCPCGPMSAEEARAFERERFWADAVAVRRFDEQAKDPDGATPPFEHFASLLEQLVARRL